MLINNTKIKICGIKTLAEIEIINKYPISYAGFIFADSKRQVSIDRVILMKDRLRNDIKKVGVFVNEKKEVINEVIEKCELDIIQLHGDETIDFCQKFNIEVWKSISVKNEKDIENGKKYSKYVDKILLDTFNEKLKGGSGKKFNWEIAKNLSKDFNIILAGGINKDNILEAINIVKPEIIDVNSGVEKNLIKNEEKIRELFEIIRRKDDE